MKPEEILVNIEAMLKEAEDTKRVEEYYPHYWSRKPKTRNVYKKWRIWDVCDELEIFDWWNEYLSVSQLKQMRAFLKAAIKRGFTGYACFKVGAVGCANGMWANKAESTTGYSPDGACLYHSFVTGQNCWSVCGDDEKWSKYDGSLKDVDEFIKANGI